MLLFVILDMTISTNFKEEYLDKTGIFNLYREATGFNPKTSNNNIGLKDFLKLMPKSKRNMAVIIITALLIQTFWDGSLKKLQELVLEITFQKKYSKMYPQYNAFITLDHENSREQLVVFAWL